MEIDDIPLVYHLGDKLFTSESPNLYHTWDEHAVIDLYKSDPDLCFVAVTGEKIIGFMLGTTVEKSRSSWKYGYLEWLGVDPKYHGCGVAVRLYKNLKSALIEKGMRIMLLDTEADNQAAIKFFRKMGFGSPEKHLYMSINLAKKKGKGGKKKKMARRKIGRKIVI